MAACAITRKDECVLESELQAIAESLNAYMKDNIIDTNSPILPQLKRATNCDDSLCVVDTLLERLRGTPYESLITRIRDVAFKPLGPRDRDALMDNFVLFKYAMQVVTNLNTKRLYFGGIVLYDFNIDPITTEWGDPNAVVASAFEKGWEKFYLILNTDHRYGLGTHWVLLIIDKAANQIQYFNSTGRGAVSGGVRGTPTREYPDGIFVARLIEWIDNVAVQFQRNGCPMRYVYNRTRHQSADDLVNCGVYCAYVLTESAKGKSFDEINKRQITAEQMREYRKEVYIPSS